MLPQHACPCARAQTVSGEQLGYVPRRATGLFTLEVRCGRAQKGGARLRSAARSLSITGLLAWGREQLH